MVKRKRWMFGQAATMLGTGTQVAALAVAPVAVVQPMLAVGLVVALGLRAIRTRQAPLRLELFGAALTTGGLAVFLRRRPAGEGDPHRAAVLDRGDRRGRPLRRPRRRGDPARARRPRRAGLRHRGRDRRRHRRGAHLGRRPQPAGGRLGARVRRCRGLGGDRGGGGRDRRRPAGLCPRCAGVVAARADPDGPARRHPRRAVAARRAPGARPRRRLGAGGDRGRDRRRPARPHRRAARAARPPAGHPAGRRPGVAGPGVA